MDKVAVLVSIYNEPDDWISQSIGSLVNQSLFDTISLEIIVILDNPERELENLINLFYPLPKNIAVVFHKNECNLGLARSLNKAFSLSSGNYIARMDADDISHKNRIYKQYSFFKKSNYALIGCGINRIDEDGKILNTVKLSDDPNQLIRSHGYKTLAFHPTWFMSREIFTNVGGYRAYPNAQDFDFLSRLLDKGYLVSNVQDILLDYRLNLSSLSFKKALRQRKCQFHILKMNKERAKLNIEKFDEAKMLEYIESGELMLKLHSFSQRMLLLASKKTLC